MAATFAHESIPRQAAVPRSVDELLALDVPTLERLYREARVPAIQEVKGNLVGRMLPAPAAHPAVQDAMRAFARQSFFPWRGKTFAPRDAHGGEGWNRVFSDKNLWFRFTTSIGPSRAGAFDALHLDYDHPENPFFIRAIQDEIRTVAPGLWLGQAWLVLGGKPSLGENGRAWLALYFALQNP
ncbi:MAG: hypothetical protein HYV09_31395 [Deltaproteobacteria bacterium]|nr:hypothetical protein [Deltaproteobacteria bacterium]